MEGVQQRELVIVTGMSGAGKTVALKAMEDLGFYCVDNLPVFLLETFAELLLNAGENRRAAVGIDIRSGDGLPKLRDVLNTFREKGIVCRILFLDASDRVLLKRFKETRRKHPLAPDGRPEDGILRERKALSWLKEQATYVIDTSRLLTRDLRLQLEKLAEGSTEFRNLYITVLSFGFKYGLPEDADLIFDVRFLPNPYYDETLREQTGLEEDVRAYVMQGEDGEVFLGKLYGMMDFLIPRYIAEGRNQLIIGIGCTGGRHRSVTVAEALYRHLSGAGSYGLNVEHRDIRR